MLRVALAALLLAACGGGGGSSGAITPAPTPRTDLLFGYYGGCPSCPFETQDHANLYMTRPWGAGGPFWLLEVLLELQTAKGNNQKVMLGLPGAYDLDAGRELTFAWERIIAAGLSDQVIALYPIDEPDVHGKSDAEVTATNAMLRRIFGSLPLAVIYGCATGKRPGLASYDWAGCDDYGQGCAAATGIVASAFQSRLRPDQRLILVPGGADPWRQDPACFAHKAHSDPQVVAILAFLWIDNAAAGVGLGIRSNGLRRLYCETGRLIKQTNPETC